MRWYQRVAVAAIVVIQVGCGSSNSDPADSDTVAGTVVSPSSPGASDMDTDAPGFPANDASDGVPATEGPDTADSSEAGDTAVPDPGAPDTDIVESPATTVPEGSPVAVVPPAEEGVPSTEDPSAAPAPDDGSPVAGVISADNYAELVSQTFSLARVVFGDGSGLSDTLDEFAAPAEPFFGIGPPRNIAETIGCLGGGAFTLNGPLDGFERNLAFAFSECVANPGIVNGTYNDEIVNGGGPGGGHIRNYDIVMSADVFGAELITLDGELALRGQGTDPLYTYTVANYTAGGPRYSLTASGSGNRQESGGGRPYSELLQAELQIAYQPGSSGPEVVYAATMDPDVQLSPDGTGVLPGGVITITASDDSSATISASDVEEIASVEIFDASGMLVTSDSRPWADLF